VNTERRCPKCGEELLRSWDQLTPEEQEVVKSLQGSADYQAMERQAMHRWCTRCWYEAVGDETQT
jgi:hypothetical protein